MATAKFSVEQLIPDELVINKIYVIRGIKVMLDKDLAALYEVETKVFNQAVKRNIKRFPADFMFKLEKEEFQSLRSQIVTLEIGRGKYSKYLPLAFTEQGCCHAKRHYQFGESGRYEHSHYAGICSGT